MNLKTNAKYRPPYTYNSIFGGYDSFFLQPKALRFLAVPVTAEEVVEKQLKRYFNFDYSMPALEQSEFLDPISQLHRTKIDVYRNNYPFESVGEKEKFAHMISKIAGLISGHTRAYQTKYIMSVLTQFKAKSPNLFNRFSLSQWKLFSEAVFGKAPTRANLMLLTSEKKGSLVDYSYLKSQQSSKEIIDFLLRDYQEKVALIRSDFEKSCNEFSEKANKIKADSNKQIAAIKANDEL